MRKKLRTMVAMAAVATLAASGAATAAQPLSKAKPATVAYQGVQVAIDPATGRLRAPTAAERQALSNAILRDQAKPAAGQRPRTESEALSTLKINRKGRLGMSMQVPDSQFNYLTAERNADGTISIRHEGEGESPAPQQEVTQ
jgi:hypothetical protein